MIYFAGGANNDKDGWNYIPRFKAIFEDEKIAPFVRIDFSLGKERDIWFTCAAATDAWFVRDVPYGAGTPIPGTFDRSRAMSRSDHNGRIAFQAGRHMHEHLASTAAGGSAQINLMGYSYGSVLMAHAALIMADNNDSVSNLILVGSPIPSNSPLYNVLTTNARIARIIRFDIPGDRLSNPSQWFAAGTLPSIIAGAFESRGTDGPHFDLARPDDPQTPVVDEGAEADARIRALARSLHEAGVR